MVNFPPPLPAHRDGDTRPVGRSGFTQRVIRFLSAHAWSVCGSVPYTMLSSVGHKFLSVLYTAMLSDVVIVIIIIIVIVYYYYCFIFFVCFFYFILLLLPRSKEISARAGGICHLSRSNVSHQPEAHLLRRLKNNRRPSAYDDNNM